MKAGQGIPKLLAGTTKFLALDPSSAHSAYCLVDLDEKSKIAHLDAIGMLWAGGSWNKGQQFLYINRCLDALAKGVSGTIPDEIITEQFFMNVKFRSGVGVIPVINGIVEKVCAEHGNIPYHEVPPPTWRSTLGVKHDTVVVKGKNTRDYKTPTKVIVERYIGKLPEEIKSNITLNMRATPHDIYDAIAIAIAVCKSNGYEQFKLSNTVYNNFSLFEKFNNLSKELDHEKVL